MKHPNLSDDEFDKVWFPVVTMFLAGLPVADIAAAIKRDHRVTLSREGVYPIVREAAKKNLMQLTPPRDIALAEHFKKFNNKGEVAIVRARGRGAVDHIVTTGAEMVAKLILQLAHERGPNGAVRVGLGIGHTTHAFAQRLAAFVRRDTSIPSLVLHALSPPHSFGDPLETPLASFSFFADACRKVEFVGLIASPIVQADEYEREIAHDIVDRAFARRGEIDIVVTSLAASDDEHGHLANYVKSFDPKGIQRLRRAGWVGDMQLRPYSARGPIEMNTGIKPITLFELRELAAMTKQGKHVFVLCGPCGQCDQDKAKALLPLLREPKLHLWNHLVLDLQTAEKVLAEDSAA